MAQREVLASLPACLPACSALRDRRFAPIEARELPQLKCTVSLLSGFEVATGWEDWEIGTHGEPALATGGVLCQPALMWSLGWLDLLFSPSALRSSINCLSFFL